MNRNIYCFAIITIALLSACKGSDTYRGSWKALGSDGQMFELFFEEDTVVIRDRFGHEERAPYKQNSVSMVSHVETYGIILDGQNKYNIVFPSDGGEHKGYIETTDHKVLYSIARDKYLTYEQVHH